MMFKSYQGTTAAVAITDDADTTNDYPHQNRWSRKRVGGNGSSTLLLFIITTVALCFCAIAIFVSSFSSYVSTNDYALTTNKDIRKVAVATIDNAGDAANKQREYLLRSTKKLCRIFASHGTIEEIASCFTSSSSSSSSTDNRIRLLEHGTPSERVPFLGRTFYGLDGIYDYFSLVSETLEYTNMSFSDYSLDENLKIVTVRGTATFTWKATQKSWDEIFIYRIQLDTETGDDENDNNKIMIYEVWADSGAAYLASLP